MRRGVSRSFGAVRRSKSPARPLPNPYDPTSPDFGERAAASAVQLPSGAVRIDYGEPVARPDDYVCLGDLA